MAVVPRPLSGTWARLRQPPTRWLSLLARLLTAGLAFVAVGLLFQQLAGWSQHTLDDLRYGAPRLAHLSGYVGHGDERRLPTQILALNLDGQVSILVLPGGDAQAVQVLPGPYVVGQDGPSVPALPALRDVNRDGHVDLLVTVRNEVVVYLNENGTFELVTPEEREGLQQTWER